jgi:hypothetical protein
MMPRQPPFQRSGRYQNALTDWAKDLADSGLAVTVTFGSGRGAAATSPSPRTVEEIVRKALKRLNTLCYGNAVKRMGYSIGAITAIEGTGPFERIHVHIAIEPSPNMPFKQVSRLVDRVFKRSKWIEQRPHVVECWSEDWINYMLKLGQEALVPSCCFTPKHPCA